MTANLLESDARQRQPRLGAAHLSRLVGTRAPLFSERLDPLREITWTEALHTTFRDVSTVRHKLTVERGVVVHRPEKNFSPVAVSPARSYRPVAVQMVALLAQYHQLSTYQVASWVGVPSSAVWAAASSLHAAGVIQRAIPPWWRKEGDLPSSGSGSLWQLNFGQIDTRARKDAPRETALMAWLDGLTDVEYLLVTGGRDIGQGTQGSRSPSSIRHNVVLAEIALRAVECCPAVLGAWGEPFGTAGSFTDDEAMRKNIADAVLVTRDGTLVVIETSGKTNLDNGNAGRVLGDKAAAWAAIAARSDLDIRVLFVDIAKSPSRHQRFHYFIKHGLDEYLGSYLTREPDKERARGLVGVVSAADWFPMPGMVSEGFLGLEAYDLYRRTFRPTIAEATQDSPERCLDLHRSVRRTDAVVNTLTALHTPAWTVRPPLSTLGS